MSNPPSSPPRLPSPPPFPEIQIGPKSPSLGVFSDLIDHTMDQKVVEANSHRRIHPGTKAADMAAGPPLLSMEELDTAFPLQEHLKALHNFHTKPSDSDGTTPITRETATIIATPPDGVHHSLWLYELCRFLINKCNDLLVGFFSDNPPCSQLTCPEMRASEWQFLCAVHETPKSCCAIDYCCHTLDWATNIVTNRKNFPTRAITEVDGTMGALSEGGTKQLINIFRRLHRIFAHAWFQHRVVFWNVESQTGLYVFFKTVCDTHQVLPLENFKLPPEAEGLEQAPELQPKQFVPSILRSENSNRSPHAPEAGISDMFTAMGRSSTKRHIRSSPSTGSVITTVLETDEVDDEGCEKLDEIFLTRDRPVTRIRDSVMGYVREIRPEQNLEPEVESAPESQSETQVESMEEETPEPNEEQIPEGAPKTEDAASLPVEITSAEDEEIGEEEEDNNEEKEEEVEQEEKKEEEVEISQGKELSTDGAADQKVYDEDLDEAELEAFEEVPIPQLAKDPPAEPSLKREETLKPVKPENEESSGSDEKLDEKSDEKPVPDSESKSEGNTESEATKDDKADDVNVEEGHAVEGKGTEEVEKPVSSVS